MMQTYEWKQGYLKGDDLSKEGFSYCCFAYVIRIFGLSKILKFPKQDAD